MQEILQTNALSIEKSRPGRRGVRVEKAQKPAQAYLPQDVLRNAAPKLPELSEFDTVRHFTALSEKNYCLDSRFYPLGSCTMKYNPKAYDAFTALESFANAHPLAPESAVQGTLKMMYELQEMLKAITGLAAFTLQPAAGAHGELTGIMTAKAYHAARKDKKRTEVIVLIRPTAPTRPPPIWAGLRSLTLNPARTAAWIKKPCPTRLVNARPW